MLKFKSFLSKSEDPNFMYKLMVSTIVPRPIAWVSTMNDNGSINLAPYSFFNGVTSSPPTLMFSIARKPNGDKKDTLINIERDKQFVVNTVPMDKFEAMVTSGASFSYGESEVEKTGLSLLPSEHIKTPRIDGTKVQFECELFKLVDIGEGNDVGATVVFGKIICIHLVEELLGEKNRINYQALDGIGRLGGISYCRIGEELQKQVPPAD